jgi:hypothetical protein
MPDEPERIALKDGIGFTIDGAITSAAAFNHYVLKEYAPKCQGRMALGRNPARHNLENCLFDELAGWLDSPSVTGLSILGVRVGSKPYEDEDLCLEPRISMSGIFDIMYDVCRMGAGAEVEGGQATVDAARLAELQEKCKLVLKHAGQRPFPDEKKTRTNPGQMGAGLRKGRLPG